MGISLSMDNTKIMSKLGWEPIISFELGMQMTVEWYLNNLLWSLNIQNGNYRLERLGVKI